MDNRWDSHKREQLFRSTEVDEAEIFEGAENRLTMSPTYTWEFRCKYQQQRYPFDTQVSIYRCKNAVYPPQECKIEMTVGDLKTGTVSLLANEVGWHQRNQSPKVHNIGNSHHFLIRILQIGIGSFVEFQVTMVNNKRAGRAFQSQDQRIWT